MREPKAHRFYLIVLTFFGTLGRRHVKGDYWVPDGRRIRRPKGGSIDLRHALLLGPVTTTLEHDSATQLRDKLFQIRDELIHAAGDRDR